MIKKILFILGILFISQSLVLADEIIDAKGSVIPCTIETVMGGLVEYKKGGNLYMFAREDNSPIFNDYVDVKENIFKNNSVVRYFGKIIVKDMWNVVIKNDSGNINIPFYKVKFIGVYKP